MNQYQFEKIEQRMAKQFGRMKRSELELYVCHMQVMETNMLRVLRKEASIKGDEVRNAILLTLHEINQRLRSEKEEMSEFEADVNLQLKHALLMAFDPYTNPEVRMVLDQKFGIREPEEDYYLVPVRSLLRILDSVNAWTKQYGKDGYRNLLEAQFGNNVTDDELKFAVGSKL